MGGKLIVCIKLNKYEVFIWAYAIMGCWVGYMKKPSRHSREGQNTGRAEIYNEIGVLFWFFV